MSIAKQNGESFKVYTTATEPGALFEAEAWPPTVSVRYSGDDSGFTGLEISGDEAEVYSFIARFWGEDEVESIKDWLSEQD